MTVRSPQPDHRLARPATIRRPWIGFAVVLAASVGADLVITHEPVFGLDGTFGFGAWFGFVSCVVLVLGSRAIGSLLKRRDDYYDR